MMALRYPLMQSRSSYIRYVRYGRLITKNASVLPLNKRRENGKELGIMHPNNKVSHATGASLDFLLIKVSDVYINNLTKLMAFYAPGFFRFGEQLLQKR